VSFGTMTATGGGRPGGMLRSAIGTNRREEKTMAEKVLINLATGLEHGERVKIGRAHV
jgi:hypothetical protein